MRPQRVVGRSLAVTLLAVGLGPANGLPSAAAAGQVASPYVDGRTIHDGGTTVTIAEGPDQPAAGVDLFGLGRTDDGRWAVRSSQIRTIGDPGDPCTTQEIWLVTSGGDADLATSRTACLYDDEAWSLGLSDTGDRFFEQRSESSGRTWVTVRSLDGSVVVHRSVPDWLRVLDFTAHRLVLGTVMAEGDEALWTWTLGEGMRRVVRGTARGADLQAGVQWRQATRGRWALRRLSDPGTVLWRLRFRPVVFSPDRRRVLGVATTSTGADTSTLQVRRVGSGTLVRTVRPAIEWADDQMGWDGNGAVFGPRSGGSDTTLVRCPLRSWCAVAQPISQVSRFSVVEQD